MLKIGNTELRKMIREEIDNFFKNINNDFDFEVDNVTYEQAKRQFVDYAKIVDFPDYSSPINNVANNSISENITKSLPLKEVKHEIMGKHFLEDWQFKIKTAKNDIEIGLIIPQINKNISLIKKDMKTMGYFCSMAQSITLHDLPYIGMRFEPLFQDNINNEIKNIGSLYHITLTTNVKNILKNGFIPSNKNKLYKYPNRIYFIKGNVTPKEIVNMVYRLSQVSGNGLKDYSLLYIDTDNINSNIEFYYDPNFSQGVFTETKIDSNCIINFMTIVDYAKINCNVIIK